MRAFLPVSLLLLGSLLPGPSAGEPAEAALEEERPDQGPGRAASADAFARSPGMRVAVGSYESIQVNVDASGNNIVGDAANEPSIAVNPRNRTNKVIGWRQFDTVGSNFRQAGWAYTFDAGQSWTFPGVLEPGIFRSDPSLVADSDGRFFYQSLRGDLRADVFRSVNGGVSWSVAVPEFGGDKNWLAVDRSGGPGEGFLYGIWQRFGGPCCGSNVFTRSIDAGSSFQFPVPVPFSPTFGTLTVGPSGEVYATGIDGTSTQDFTHYVVAKSINAGNSLQAPAFTGARVNLGGTMVLSNGPNPGGLLGQPNVFVNPVAGPRHGDVYVLGSVDPAGTDPLDVSFIRSPNGGTTWSAPLRINDDAVGNWQWMGAGDVSPNGRIDAVWNDTRSRSISELAQLYYAYSWDGGVTWSPNVQVSPTFNTALGYPNQNKMGDYSTVVSDDTGADVAYTATFNDEQDVYYVRIFPDCNSNGVSDVTDLLGPSVDCDGNRVPDECQAVVECLGAGTLLEGLGGTPLTVERGPGGDLTLRWGVSCGSGDDDFAVYEGTLGSFASHVSRFCSTGGQTTQALTPAAGDTYYLVVPTRSDREGSYGIDSGGIERPQGADACLAQLVRPCGT